MVGKLDTADFSSQRIMVANIRSLRVRSPPAHMRQVHVGARDFLEFVTGRIAASHNLFIEIMRRADKNAFAYQEVEELDGKGLRVEVYS